MLKFMLVTYSRPSIVRLQCAATIDFPTGRVGRAAAPARADTPSVRAELKGCRRLDSGATRRGAMWKFLLSACHVFKWTNAH